MYSLCDPPCCSPPCCSDYYPTSEPWEDEESDLFTLVSDPFTFLVVFSDPLDHSGSTCRCASDGDSEGLPR
eukprot:10792046-Heterocapsa_arctica.AAC.1